MTSLQAEPETTVPDVGVIGTTAKKITSAEVPEIALRGIGDGSFSCTLCGKKFGYKNGLMRHLRLTHVGEKPYECNICQRRFGYKHILNEHQNLHYGNRPYACSECDKKFAARSNLIQHRMVHKRPFHCSFCRKRFDKIEQLRKHELNHPQIQLYCSACKFKTNSQSQLSEHHERCRVGEEEGKRLICTNSLLSPDTDSADSPVQQQQQVPHLIVQTNLQQSLQQGLHLQQTNLQQAHVQQANLQLANLHQANLQENLQQAHLQQANLQLAHLQQGNLQQANLQQTHLSQVNLAQSNLLQVNLSQANLTHVNISQANLPQGNIPHNYLAQANLSQVNLPQVNLSQVNLSPADLTQANHSPTNLTQANISQENLTRENRPQVNISPTNLSHANPSQANLLQVNILRDHFQQLPQELLHVKNRQPSYELQSRQQTEGQHAQQQPTHKQQTDKQQTDKQQIDKQQTDKQTDKQQIDKQQIYQQQAVTTATPSTRGHLLSNLFDQIGDCLIHGVSVKHEHHEDVTSMPTPLPVKPLPGIQDMFSRRDSPSPFGLSQSIDSSHLAASQSVLDADVVFDLPGMLGRSSSLLRSPLQNPGSLTDEPMRNGVSSCEASTQFSSPVPGLPDIEELLSMYVSQGRLFRCSHCNIFFLERGMYFLHVSLHGSVPWECSICHKQCQDKNEFTVHFVNQQHSI